MTLTTVIAQVIEQVPEVVKNASPVVHNFQLAVGAFLSGGWIVGLIGAAAMVGRLLVDEAADASWQRSLRHVIAAAIFAVIAYFLMFQWDVSALNKAIVQGLCGAVAPELVDWISTNIRQKLGFKAKARKRGWKKLFARTPKKSRRRRRVRVAAVPKASPRRSGPKARASVARRTRSARPKARKPTAAGDSPPLNL